MSVEIDPRDAKALLHGPGECAFLDVREAGQFGEGHPLFAAPCPYSRLELMVGALVPRRSVPVLLIDEGDGVAARAARRLEAAGYEDVRIVAGGAPGWAASGFVLFKGVNVPSKTLGEMAEAVWHPTMIDATTLAAWRNEGRDVPLFDTRPASEYAKMRVPGAVCLPNGELAHRFAAAVPHPERPIVITCAGRTRGLTGLVGLRAAGYDNPIFALENGTQGWALAGYELERGNQADAFPPLDAEGEAASRARAERMAERWSIPWADAAALDAMQADATRTLYRLDVRSLDEHRAGHPPGFVHAPGGQAVQSSDQWMATRRARVVLGDDTGLRGMIAAFWLRQLGYEVFVLRDVGRLSVEGVEPGPSLSCLPAIAPADAAEALKAGARLLDLRGSQAFRAGHATAAEWAIRPRLDQALQGFRGPVVLVADEPEIADLAAIDLAEMGIVGTRRLDGGLSAWQAAGLDVASGETPSDAEAIDFLLFVHDRHDGNLESSRRYLEWEQGLMAQLDEAERGEFRLEMPEKH